MTNGFCSDDLMRSLTRRVRLITLFPWVKTPRLQVGKSLRDQPQYKFLPGGRYAYGLGTSTTFGNLETRTGSVGDGRYSLRDTELIITPDARASSKYRIRIYDEYLGGVWRRAMSLLNESTTPPLDVQYMRIEE